MTTIEGLPISNELACVIKSLCRNVKNNDDSLLFGIDTISEIQDIVTLNLCDIESDKRKDIENTLSDLVLFKQELKKLYRLLPVLEGGLV